MTNDNKQHKPLDSTERLEIGQVADYGLQTYQVALPMMRGTPLQVPQIQPFAILRVMGCRSLKYSLGRAL